ncbi:MFS transporter [Herbaspirillum sp. C7C8]|uniref:MFS transporter n=1 Tax=Herbaspirillum sp. C7C8 TaxID=2736665 RepID=UPI001F527813|nr:MFS transporter [Herbaspirillum sp. C7C8]MCI1007216.1 MFS transporter [Herbaspirillum sp. C7C8]
MRWITWLVTGALFMEILDGAITIPAIPAMARDFGVTPLALNVGISAYLLAVGIFIPASSWIADRFGSRRVFMSAIALFTLSSVLCGLVRSLPGFVVIRIVQGISGALMVPVGRLVILRQTPREKLMAAMSALVWPALVAPVLGPPLGGLISQHLGWQWIFLINAPLGLVAWLAAWRIIPDVRAEELTGFDWSGFLLCGVGISLLLTALEKLESSADAVSLVSGLTGLALIALACRHFLRSSAPMLDLAALRIPTFRFAMLSGTLARMAIGAVPFLLTLMFQLGFGDDASTAGLLVLALFAGNLLMKTMTTRVLREFGYRQVLLCNGALCALTLLGCAQLQPADSPVLVVPLLIAAGMTRSMQFTALGTIGFADVPKTMMGHANGLFNTISQLGMAAGITVASVSVRLAHGGPSHALAQPIIEDFHSAFIVLALMVVASLAGVVRLPAHAGQDFIQRRSDG